MPKLVISLAFFESSSDSTPQRVANIGFIDNGDALSASVRLALKESGLMIFEKELPASPNLVSGIINNGRESLYAPDNLVGWVLSLIKRNAVTILSGLADLLLHSRIANKKADAGYQKGGQNVRS